MSLTYPIPRGTRVVDLVASADQAVFGPVEFMLYDPLDVTVWVTSPGDVETKLDPASYTVTPAAPASAFPAFFSITLATGVAASSQVTIAGTRTPERDTDVTRGGTLQSARLEQELDKMTVVTQELRRDVERHLGTSIPGSSIDAHGMKITDMADPTEPADATTKRYVDDADAVLLALISGGETSGPDSPIYSTRAAASSAEIAGPVQFVGLTGFAVVGDCPWSIYKRVAAMPAHLGRFRSVDRFLPNGSVSASDGGWWELTGSKHDVRQYGVKADGVTDDTVAAQGAIDGPAKVLEWPPGTILIGAAGLSGVSNQVWQGAGKGVTILKLSANPTSEFVIFGGKSNFEIRDMTFDWNNKVASGINGILSIIVSTDWAVRRVGLIHGTKIGLSLGANTRWIVEHCDISRDAIVASVLNQAILITEVAGPSSKGRVHANNMTNWATLIGGTNTTIFSENIIDGYGYGAGIGGGNSDTCIYINNMITGGLNALDADGTRPGGIESFVLKAVITGNIIWNNGGCGIHRGAQYGVVSNNLIYNNGTFGLVNPAFKFGGIESRWADAGTHSAYNTFTGNVCFDQTGTQSYGFSAVPAGGPITAPDYNTITGNWFSGVISPMLETSGIRRSFVGPCLEGQTGIGVVGLGNGAGLTTTLAVTGAALGDRVTAGINVDAQGCTITAYVQSANTVAIRYQNGTGGTISIPSHTIRVSVEKASDAGAY